MHTWIQNCWVTAAKGSGVGSTASATAWRWHRRWRFHQRIRVWCAAVWCSVLQCVAVCCSALQCVAVCCSVLQCVAMRCSWHRRWRFQQRIRVWCAAVWCSVLQCVAVCCSALQYVAVCCSMLQCVAVCCSVLQCVVVGTRRRRLRSRIRLWCVAVCYISCRSVLQHSCAALVDTGCWGVLQLTSAMKFLRMDPGMGWLRLVGSIKLQVSFAEYSLFYRAFLQKRPII